MYRGFLFAVGGAALISLPSLIAVALETGPRALGILLDGFGVRAFLGAILTARLRLIFSADHLQSVAAGLIALTMIISL